MNARVDLGAQARSSTTFNSRVKANLSGLLFGSAILLEAHARTIERETKGTPQAPADQDLDEHRTYVLGGLMAVAAALEASINEFFADVDDRNIDKVGRVLGDDRAVNTMCELWPQIEPSPILQKFQTALSLCGLPQFDRGGQPYQDAESVVKLRNALMHFKPEWDDDREIHQGLENRLRAKFRLNPMLPDGAIWFPHRCLSADCLEWACRSVGLFANDFSTRLGIKGTTDTLSAALRRIDAEAQVPPDIRESTVERVLSWENTNPDHFRLRRQGVAIWNTWRAERHKAFPRPFSTCDLAPRWPATAGRSMTAPTADVEGAGRTIAVSATTFTT
jgi:hypothetical protein